LGLPNLTASTMISRFGIGRKVRCHKGAVENVGGGDNFDLDPSGGVLAVFRDGPPNGVEVVASLRRELKRRFHPRFRPEASDRAHIEAIAQRFQGGDAVDAGGVLDVGEVVDLFAEPIRRGALQKRFRRTSFRSRFPCRTPTTCNGTVSGR